MLADTGVAQVHCCDWRSLLDVVPRCDALIVDAPYSERTHAGHADGTECANRGTWNGPDGVVEVAPRRPIDYGAWGDADVAAFVAGWSPRVTGWLVSITDHILAPVWCEVLEAAGRYVFAPLAFTAPGSRVRLGGDGPSNWSTWIVVARPKTRDFQRWGTLPGAYVLPPGHAERMDVVGGKPLWLMERLCEDYSRPGDLIVDPCCGAGTTLVAAVRTGRRAIGGDVLREHAEIAARRIQKPQQQPLFLAGGANG